MKCKCGEEGTPDELREHIRQNFIRHGLAETLEEDRRREELFQRMLRSSHVQRELSRLTDAEFADLLLAGTVYGNKPVWGVESVLIEQARERLLRTACGPLGGDAGP